MSRVDLILVTPPSRLGVYQELSEWAAIEPPVWSGLLARHCMNEGYRVEILDAEALGLDSWSTAKRIAEAKPLLAAFSVYGHQPSASTQCMPAAKETVELLGSLGPHIPTLAFGTHPSALPEMTVWEGFDYACQGEGVYTLPALLLMHHLGQKVTSMPSHLRPPGIWWSPNKAKWAPIMSVPPAALTKDLDRELPSQAWELLDMKRYRAHHWHKWTGRAEGGYASVQTSLGCPFKCSFCCINAPFGTPGFRTWSPKNVAGQIERLVSDYGITNIKIPDEMFVLNPKHVQAICLELIDRNLGGLLNMWAYARIDTVKDEETLALMRQAGFRWLALGIESASKHVRDGVEKGRFGNEDILRACKRVESFGLHIMANYIFGLPDDTDESMKETLRLAYEVNAAGANFYCAMAYPGSPLHRLATQKKWALPEGGSGPGWSGYSQHSYDSLPLRTETLTAEQVLDFRDSAYMLYHTRPDYLAKLERSFGLSAVGDMTRITALGKPRRKHRDPDPFCPPYDPSDEEPF